MVAAGNQFQIIEIRAEARVGGERVVARQNVAAVAWDSDEAFRDSVREAVRVKLMLAILEKWKPKISIRTPEVW